VKEEIMANTALTLACQNHDHTRALADTTVRAAGIDLKVINISPPSQIFLRMLNNEEFDISEMSLSNYLIALGNDDRRFIALPVFPSRVFRHSYVWINANAGIEKPRDLIGKRVGIADYSMTSVLFTRGFLTHQYGIRAQEIHWFRRRREHVAITIPEGVRIDDIGKDETLDDLLEQGKLDALAVTQPPRGFVAGSPNINRLFPNPREAEAAYYRETKIYPIMHTVVMRRAIYDKEPSLAMALAEAFQEAKEQSYKRMDEKLYALPWLNLDLEFARQVMGRDTCAYGVKASLPTLEAATLYSYEQGLTKRKLDVSELFAPETMDLFGE
jgi:4,5-dihydroxyphthalate decarboxylase